MISIPVIRGLDGVLAPSEPIPESAIAVVCNGETYTVYEDGDELPVVETVPAGPTP